MEAPRQRPNMPPRFAAIKYNTIQFKFNIYAVLTYQVDAAELKTCAICHHVIHLVVHVYLEEVLIWRYAK